MTEIVEDVGITRSDLTDSLMVGLVQLPFAIDVWIVAWVRAKSASSVNNTAADASDAMMS